MQIVALLCLLLSSMAATEAARDPPKPVVIAPDCKPQRDPGVAIGSYEPKFSAGQKVYRSAGSMTDEPSDGYDEFNRTSALDAVISLVRSPYEVEPPERGEEVAGVINRTGSVVPTSPTGAGGPSRLLREERELNVFLPDTRADVNVYAYPYRTVGKWRGCTATLVRDKAIVVTNAHCLKYLSNGKMDPTMWDTSFYAGFKNGNYLASSKPKAIWYDKGDDYAVMKLWSPLDQQLGRMGVYWRDEGFFSSADRPLKMVSYSGDHCASWNNCKPMLSTGKSRGTVWIGNELKHDLDAKRGSSGSSMYQLYSGMPVVEALNFAEDRNGGEVSLTLKNYDGGNPNYAKPAGVFKVGYDKVKIY